MSDEKPDAADLRELDLFDYQLIRNIIGFIFRGVKRHRVLSLGAFLVIAALGVIVTIILPRSYHAEARLLANQNQLIRALGNPRSSLQSEDPTRAAREIIFAHDNVVSLIKQTNLMKQWEDSRPFVIGVRDSLVRIVAGPQSEEDKVDAMVGTLEKRLKVETDQQTVTISIDWPDAQMAYLLVETAQQNFLETRHATEMAAIGEALSILEMHEGMAQKSVDEALRELEAVREQRRKGVPSTPTAPSPRIEGTTTGPAPAPVAAPPPPPSPALVNAPPAATEQELAQLKFLLNSKKRALADLEDFRSRRLNELTTQLQEQKVQYADQHPIILDTLQRIAAIKIDSSQVTQVKGDIQQLLEEYRRKGGKDPDSIVEPSRARSGTGGAGRGVRTATAALSNSELSDDPLVEFARNNLRVASAKYEELMMRIDGARIEQDTARAAFKYRYSVIRPASVPKKPLKPDVAVLLVATLLAALGIAVLVGGLRDVLGGHFIESWQVARSLNLKVLSEVKSR